MGELNNTHSQSTKNNQDVKNIAKKLGERYSELISDDVGKIHKVSITDSDVEDNNKNNLRERHPIKKSNELSPRIKRYYNEQKNIIHSFMEAENLLKNTPKQMCNTDTDDNETTIDNMGITDYVDIFRENKNKSMFDNVGKHARIAITISFIVNILLFIVKIIAACFSNSMSIISSTIDSGIDIVTTCIAFWMDRTINKINIYKHPQGKRRLEPIGILIIACVMSVASFQVISESIKRMVTKVDLVPTTSYVSFGIIGCAILSKFILAIYCGKVRTPSTDVIRQDHINDVISNSFALVGFVLSSYVWTYADSAFALVISVYICFNWCRTAKENIRYLVGKSASPQAIQRLTWICIHHHCDIVAIDTVRAYTFGVRYLVEVDLVLPETMPLRMTHDIGETLQQKLETLPEVERAFVHVDYESTHKPGVEHRIVCVD